jgi:hypothetical protein
MTNGLYKYFSTHPDKVERFTNGSVYLTPPEYLNDPWEFLLRNEPPTLQQCSTEFPRLAPEKMAELQTKVSSADFLQDVAREQQEVCSRLVGLVCLTEEPLDRLMWAHYGESHKGFVAEFAHSGDEGKKTEYGFRYCEGPFGQAVKVQYEPEPPDLKPDHPNLEQRLLTKHRCWTSEKEWRVFRFLQEGDAHPTKNGFVLLRFKPIDLRRVIFGLRTPPELKFQLRQMLNHTEFNHVRQEEVYIDPDSRKLKSRPLSW